MILLDAVFEEELIDIPINGLLYQTEKLQHTDIIEEIMTKVVEVLEQQIKKC